MSAIDLAKWAVTEVGGGCVRETPAYIDLTITPTDALGRYHNAQIADYAYGGRIDFRWRPPLTLTLRARATIDPQTGVGTAGFGFWNHPFSPDSGRVRLPRALWFFYAAPPNDLRLADGVPGHGWKAATLDATRPQAWTLAPFAPAAVALMRIPALYRRLYPFIQRRLSVAEAALDPAILTAWHTYRIDWRLDGATFAVDDRVVLETPFAPRGACGLIAWIDCQYAVVHPTGRIAFGVVPLRGAQTLLIESITIEKR
ncbi:MAG: hypothetical protein SGI73_17370 [Chloroflexota bacterium]|nr:hypothetical protein [Chloroflexota bacterium]